jgi:Arc/MetJ-type ribon-helix-helix transcriptional regulator
MPDYDPQVTLRIPLELKNAALKLAEKRGIKNLSDFIRQAVVIELKRAEVEADIEAHKVTLAKQALEAEARGTKPTRFDYGLPANVAQKKNFAPKKTGHDGPTPPVPSPPKAV